MESLKKNTEFQNVFRTGGSKGTRLVILYAVPNGRETSRVGITVSKKVGNSVVRHRVKRLIREVFRLHEQEIPAGYDFVAIARSDAKGEGYAAVEKAVLRALSAHRLPGAAEGKA